MPSLRKTAVVALLPFLAACATLREPARTPEGTFSALQRVLENSDYPAFYALFSSATRRSFSRYIAAMEPAIRSDLETKALDPEVIRSLPAEEAFVRIMTRNVELEPDIFREVTEGELQGEAEVFGDVAVVRYRPPGAGETRHIELLLEEGRWRLNDFFP